MTDGPTRHEHSGLCCHSLENAFVHRRPAAMAPEGPTSITEHEAVLMLMRFVTVAARTALGDGLPKDVVAQLLRSEADAIDGTWDVAEDMSPIQIHMA